jgi:2-iminobutanoate/2-iminopropanoate deaminase
MSHFKVIRGPGVPNSALPFSPALRVGDFVYLSGFASVDEQGKIIHDTFENEMRRTYQIVGKVLAAAGLNFSHVVQVRAYLGRQEYWDQHNVVYREFFQEPFPVRTTLVGCLGDLVKYEADIVAYAGSEKI